MTLERVLLVDDSEAVLAFERAALVSYYALTTAADGIEALQQIAAARPDAVVLDLSMPRLDGEDVLRRCKADPRWSEIPFVVVSAEHARAQRCLALGAESVLAKPFRAEDLVAHVARAIDRALVRARGRGLAVLEGEVGGVRIGLPIEAIRAVVPQPACRPLCENPPYLREMFDLWGEPVPVLDLALRIGVVHRRALVDRTLVVITAGAAGLVAVAFDAVCEPLEVPADQVERRFDEADRVVSAIVRTVRGSLPVVEPAALIVARRLRALAAVLQAQRDATAAEAADGAAP